MRDGCHEVIARLDRTDFCGNVPGNHHGAVIATARIDHGSGGDEKCGAGLARLTHPYNYPVNGLAADGAQIRAVSIGKRRHPVLVIDHIRHHQTLTHPELGQQFAMSSIDQVRLTRGIIADHTEVDGVKDLAERLLLAARALKRGLEETGLLAQQHPLCDR